VQFTVEAFHPTGTLFQQTCGSYKTALEYFFDTRCKDFELAVEKKEHRFLYIGTWLRLQVVPFIVELEWNNGPFPLNYPDLGAGNFIFDDEFNIIGVIDWTSVGTVLTELFGMLTDFDTYNPSGSEADNLFWDLLEDKEKAAGAPLAPLSRYMKSADARFIASFEFGFLRGEVVVETAHTGPLQAPLWKRHHL
jgi:hypothetical protein